MAVKNRIKKLLDSRNYTQADLATMLDISLVAMNNIINNKSNPSVVIAMNIAKIFNVKIEDIFYEEDENAATNILNDKIYNFDHATLEEKEDLLKDILYTEIQNIVSDLRDKNQKIFEMLKFEYEWKPDVEIGLYEKFDYYVNFQLRTITKLMDESLNENLELRASLEKLLDAVTRYNQKLLDKNMVIKI